MKFQIVAALCIFTTSYAVADPIKLAPATALQDATILAGEEYVLGANQTIGATKNLDANVTINGTLKIKTITGLAGVDSFLLSNGAVVNFGNLVFNHAKSASGRAVEISGASTLNTTNTAFVGNIVNGTELQRAASGAGLYISDGQFNGSGVTTFSKNAANGYTYNAKLPTIVPGAVATTGGNGGNAWGGAITAETESGNSTFLGKTIFAENRVVGGNGEGLTSTEGAAVTGGNGGNIWGAAINRDTSGTNSAFVFDAVDFTKNVAMAGNGGAVIGNIADPLQSATGGRGGSVTGGVIYNDVDKDTTFNKASNFISNNIVSGAGGKASAFSGTITSGQAGNIVGGLIANFESDLTFNDVVMIRGNTVRTASDGVVESRAKAANASVLSVVGDNTDNMAGGLIATTESNILFAKTVTIQQNPVSTAHGISIKSAAADTATASNSRSIFGGALDFQDNSTVVFSDNLYFTKQNVSSGNGGSSTLYAINSTAIAGNSGNVRCGLICIIDGSLTLANTSGIAKFNISGSNIVVGNAGSAESDVTATAGKSGEILGGLIAAIDSDFVINSETNITGSKVIVGNGGNAKTKSKITTSTATGGNVGMVRGGLIYAMDGSDMNVAKLNVAGNAVSVGMSGSANAAFGNATAGNGSVIYGGLINLYNKIFNSSSNVSFVKNNISARGTGSATVGGDGTATAYVGTALGTDWAKDMTLDSYGIFGGVIMSMAYADMTNHVAGNLDINSNTVSLGNGGSANVTGVVGTSTGVVATGGQNGFVTGGLIYSDTYYTGITNAFEIAGNTNIIGNTVKQGHAGNATTVRGDATAGVGMDIYGGLIYGMSSSFDFAGAVSVLNNKTFGGNGGNAANKGSIANNTTAGKAGTIWGSVLLMKSAANFGAKTVFQNNAAIGGHGGSTVGIGTTTAGEGGWVNGGALALVDSNLDFDITTLKDTAASGLINDIVIFSGNSARGGNGGNITYSSGSTTPAGKGGTARGGAIYAQGGTITFNNSVYFNGNSATGGNGGNVSTKVKGAPYMAGGMSGFGLGGAIHASNGSDIKFTGKNIMFANNSANMGKGGRGIGGALPNNSNAKGGAIYMIGIHNTMVKSKMTFESNDVQNIIFAGNKAWGASNSIYMDEYTELNFNLNNAGSVADIRDGIASSAQGSAEHKMVLNKTGAGSLFIGGNNIDWKAEINVNDGVFGVYNTGKIRSEFGMAGFTRAELYMTGNAYFGVQLNPLMAANAITGSRESKVTFNANVMNVTNTNRFLPMGILLQASGTNYKYSNVMYSSSGSQITNIVNGLFANMATKVDPLNVTMSGIKSGNGLTINVTKKREFSEAFELDAWVDKYLKTLDPVSLATFDRVFIEGSLTDTASRDYITRALGQVKVNSRLKLFNQMAIAKSGLNQVTGLLKVYGIGKGTIADPMAFGGTKTDIGETGMWVSNGTGDALNFGTTTSLPYGAVGMDKNINAKTRIGFASVVYDGVARTGNNAFESSVKGSGFGAYAKHNLTPNTFATLSLAADQNKTRSDDTAIITGSIQSDYESFSYAMDAQVGHDIGLWAGSVLTPYVGFNYSNYKRDAYLEHTAMASGTEFDALNMTSVRTPVGMRFGFNADKTTVFADVSYAYDFGDNSVDGLATIRGNGNSFSYVVPGAELGRNVISMNFGFARQIDELSSFGLSYTSVMYDNFSDHQTRATYSLRF